MYYRYIFTLGLTILLLLNIKVSYSQDNFSNDIVLNWKPNTIDHTVSDFNYSVDSDKYNGLKAYHYTISLENDEVVDVSISKVASSQTNIFSASNYNISDSFLISINYLYNRGSKTADIRIEAYKKTAINSLEKLDSFTINTNIIKSSTKETNTKRSYANNSVLATGDWYKVSISKSGIYMVSANDLMDMGFSISGINNDQIRVYGNGGGMLAEANSVFRYDDIEENAIQIHDLNTNGKFDGSDYFVFYAKGPDQWNYSKSRKRFIHKKNIYDDYAYYFITISSGNGKRILTDQNTYPPFNIEAKSFLDYAYHENDSLNLIKTGKQWYGEHYSIDINHNFDFSFPNIMENERVLVKTNTIARSTISSTMYFNVNGTERTILYSATSTHYLSRYATPVTDTFSLLTSSSSINVNTVYSKPSSSSQAWMNYITINARRHLIITGGQMRFCDPRLVGTGNSVKYKLQHASNKTEIWDISNHTTPMIMNSSFSNNNITFTATADSLRMYIANKGGFYRPTKIGRIENQNLHALSNIDYVIIYDPMFEPLAEKLANYHRNKNNLTVYKTTLAPIYNEFGSGAKDNAAIRDFMKMLYDKAKGDITKMPKYLLFFGDASYDYKNRISNNTNLIPTYESGSSLSPQTSYCTDDFFGLLDDGEGRDATGDLDLGIGRFPVTNISQAEAIINKILYYKSVGNATDDIICGNNGHNNDKIMADWKNKLCFIGDDEDGGLHTSQADQLANYVINNYPVYNIDKIFFDAYPQIITPGGQRYPDVNIAINQTVEKGTLIINYTGHGGEVGWSHESVLDVSDINSWTNFTNMPLFITATCEFSRYDDPERISAGEYILLNSNGGGIALLTTSRVSWSSSNFALNKVIFKNILKKKNGKYPTLGDIVRLSKIGSGSINNNKNFLLLGDPAMRLSYPKDNIVTTKITDSKTGLIIDTINALQKIAIHGEVQHNGNISNTFNGKVSITIFDKSKTFTTLGNDPGSPIYNFELQKSIIYKGKAEVKNGVFSFDFVVPKDISYNFGNGKISYYATNDTSDANGYIDTLIIGGSYAFADDDQRGPKLQLFMNNTDFEDYGITDQNPKLLAFVFDEHGINTVGNGIGHDISAVIDKESNKPIILNDYYQAHTGNYKSGTISYPFYKLDDGEHSLDVKVWDVYNNSSEASINFIVASNSELAMEKLFNFPNPFSDKTSIVFEHNQSCGLLDVEVRIFNNSGALVRSIIAKVNSTGYRVGPDEIVWDGTTDNGATLTQGIYIYQLRYKTIDKNGDEVYTELSNKMVMVR